MSCIHQYLDILIWIEKDKERHFFLVARKRYVKVLAIAKPQKDVFRVPKLRQHLIGTHTFIANELLIRLFPNVIFVGYRVSRILQNKYKNFNDNMS